MGRIAAVALAIAACDPRTLPPTPQVLVYVDTDLPAPEIAGRVRVDFFHAGGVWFDSRTVAVPDASAWPLSFRVFAPSASAETRVLLRVRIFPDGRERAYFGQQWEAPTSP